jgi:hypothetical protein
MAGYTDDEIKSMVEKNDNDEFEYKFQRLKFLISIEGGWLMTAPPLAAAYYDETKRCWYNGEFVATVIMARLALEELIRSHYRVFRDRLKFKSGKKVDNVGFTELINQALSDRYISKEEAKKLRHIKKYSDPYIHVKSGEFESTQLEDLQKGEVKSPTFFTQELKMYHSDRLAVSAEDDAGASLQIMINLFQNICRRTMGF